MRTLSAGLVALVLSSALFHGSASAAGFGAPSYTPRVPVSSLGLSWFDPSRLHMSTSFSMSSGFGGQTDGLQTTSLSYQFGKPLWVNVSVGNSFGPSAGHDAGKFFLQGLDAAYSPLPNMVFQVHYVDYRSAAQRSLYGAPYQTTPFTGDWSR